MIPNEIPQTISTKGNDVKTVGNFKITDATQARILVSLSDKMYTKKELAFIREYSTNAADAHIVSKKSISEIIVELPTLEKLNFRIRDFGTGLTEEQIANVYCVFGESTKRNSNEMNGLLGYGCKAGFAHADSFTVTSWINGEMSIYQCIKGDSTKLHSAILLSRVKSDEPTGIEINIPVKESSMWTVHQDAANFYKHWPVIPTILNLDDSQREHMESFRNNPPTLKGDGWEVRTKSDNTAVGVAYMGWVAYAIDWNVLYNRMSLNSQKRVMFDLLQRNDVTLFFKMGEIQFVDSREHLEYTDFTLDAMMKKIEGIFERVKDAIQNTFTPAANLWDAKKLYNSIFGSNLIELGTDDDEENSEEDDTLKKIRLLDGNLSQLEDTFSGLFRWNNIVLDSGKFRNINKFDNAYPDKVCTIGNNPAMPVMLTYRKNKKRIKTGRTTDTKYTSITASDTVAVVLNDTGKKASQATVARYLIFRDDSHIKLVHVLEFVNDTLKDSFYNEFNFEHVPVIKMSEIVDEAKTWHKANKAARKSGGGVGGTREMRYIDIDGGEIHTNELPLRDLEDGGFYIMAGEGRRGIRRVRGVDGWHLHAPMDVLTHLTVLVDKAGIDIERVYIIYEKTRETKWFQEADSKGVWTNLWTFVKEEVKSIDMVPLIDSNNFSNLPIAEDSANKLRPCIKNSESPMIKLIELCSQGEYESNKELIEALKELQLWDTLVSDKTGTRDYNAEFERIKTIYPMLEHYETILQHGRHYMSDDVTKQMADYINMVDCYVELCDSQREERVAA